LQFAYPEYNWDLTKFSIRGKKSGQRWLKVVVKQLLPGIDIFEDYQHPELIFGVMRLTHSVAVSFAHSVELDLWIPKYGIGIEYQGLFG
jgi:hypothetical protein